jgi:hypothetical protein
VTTRRCCLLMGALLALLPSEADAQSGCLQPPRGDPGWPQDATVRVTLDPSIPEPMRDAIKGAFWAGAGGSGVRFVGFEVDYFNSHAPPDLSIGVFLGRGSHMDPVAVSGGKLRRATIQIDDLVRDVAAMANHTSHELGHTFGLRDCPDCPPGRPQQTMRRFTRASAAGAAGTPRRSTSRRPRSRPKPDASRSSRSARGSRARAARARGTSRVRRAPSPW